jgi:hypothetical protein
MDEIITGEPTEKYTLYGVYPLQGIFSAVLDGGNNLVDIGPTIEAFDEEDAQQKAKQHFHNAFKTFTMKV